MLSATQYSNSYYGWKWNGSGWSVDATIKSGLAGVSWGSCYSTVFWIGSDLFLIRGSGNGYHVGWKWNGSGWDSNSTIVSGLAKINTYVSPAVFWIGTALYLIVGDFNGNFYGFKY